MSRLYPWRAKPTDDENTLINKVDNSPGLCLLQELGPLQFVIASMDSDDKNKYKVSTPIILEAHSFGVIRNMFCYMLFDI